MLAAGEVSIHLHAGAAFAKALEITRREYFDNGKDFDTALAFGAAALFRAYGNIEPSPKYTAKSARNLVGALKYYFECWPITEIITPWKPAATGKHAIEFSFAVPIPGVLHPQTQTPLLYSGRFDMIGIHENALLLGEDDKTTSSLGEQWFNHWRLSNQIIGYVWGAQQHNIPLAGFSIRGISLLKTAYGNASATVLISPWQVERWVENLITTVRSMILSYHSGQWEYNFGQTCSAFGGCDYLPLCESPTPEQWTAINFVQSEWNPLASRE